MLAQNFVGAHALGITDMQRSALITVLGMFERGEIKHDPNSRGIPDGFNMSRYHCGSTHCIVGWAIAVSGRSEFPMTEGLRAIAMPYAFGDAAEARPMVSHNDITCEHAAAALRNYLTHGHPRWSEVLAAQM